MMLNFTPTLCEIAVIVGAPSGKGSFVYIYMQTRLMGRHNEK